MRSSIPTSVQTFLCPNLPCSPLPPRFLLLLQACGYQDGCLLRAAGAAIPDLFPAGGLTVNGSVTSPGTPRSCASRCATVCSSLSPGHITCLHGAAILERGPAAIYVTSAS